MNLGLWPEAVPFDPDDGSGSQELDTYCEGVTFPPASLLVVARGLRESDWAPRAAVGLARALAAAGQDVVLADLGFEAPSLHELLSESLTEGLADVLLFGASLERVTVLPAGQSFEFVATGGFAPDPAALRTDPGWGRLLGGLADRGAVFLGYTHPDAPGLDRLAERIASVVLLTEPEEAAATAAFLPDGVRIEAMLRPARPVAGTAGEVAGDGAASVSEEAAAPVPADEPAEADAAWAAAAGGPEEGREAVETAEPIRLPKDEARAALLADLEARERAARPRSEADGAPTVEATSDAVAEPGPADGQGDPAAPEPTREATVSRPRRHWAWWWIAAVAVIGAAAVWYFGLPGEGNVEPAGPVVTPATQAPSEPAGRAMPWSVAVEAHDRLDAAVRRADSLAAEDSSIGFQVAPALVSGDRWYRILAGPLADSGTAALAMQRLVDSGLKRAVAVWDVRETPLAFLLGRFPQNSNAIRRKNEIAELGIPAYIIEVPYTNGEPWYYLYGGAYADPTEADYMRQLLRDAGLPDTLVARIGRIAS